MRNMTPKNTNFCVLTDFSAPYTLAPLSGVEIKPNVPLAWGMSSLEKLLVPKKNH